MYFAECVFFHCNSTQYTPHSIMSEQPRAVCGIAFDLVQRLSPIVRQIDFALDWTELEAGKALYRQGDEANTAYIILNGRVRSVVKRPDGKKELVDEFGRGETIGVVSTHDVLGYMCHIFAIFIEDDGIFSALVLIYMYSS